MKDVKKNPGSSISGLKAVPSQIGAMIGHDLSPAIFNDSRMRKADLQYYVGDKRTILMVVPQLAAMMDKLPNGKILFFHCVEGSLTKEDICDFFNRVCTAVPFKLEPDELHQIGTIPYSKGVDDGVKHTYYGFDISKFEPSAKKSSANIADEILEQFKSIFDGNEELQSVDAQVKVLKKGDLEKYFRRNKDGLNKLADEADYMVVFVKGGEMDEDGVSSLAYDINVGIGEKMTSDEYQSEDVVTVGSIRKKFPGSGQFEDYDVFALKID